MDILTKALNDGELLQKAYEDGGRDTNKRGGCIERIMRCLENLFK